ncbi:MAG TPA: hypothetical protein PKG52_01225 [bacterium]|nr:hypothetical protein [bacterium]HPS29397.1 hypothetical protein [bacterium]
MNKKWFNSAAVKGSGFEHIADEIVELNNLSSDKIKEIDLLFTDNPLLFFSKFKGFHFTVVCDSEVRPEDQEAYLLENPGNFFISRIGHDITNLFFPFEHFEYIEEDIIKQRTAHGIRFGKQINIIGHLLQKTGVLKNNRSDFTEIIQMIEALCRKNKISFELQNTNDWFIDNLPDAHVFNYVIEEIISNWIDHGSGGYKISVHDRELVFSNNFKGTVDTIRTKAKLRCPFRKKNTGTGAGLGLYIVSLASARGGFDWDISIHEDSFSLSLLF